MASEDQQQVRRPLSLKDKVALIRAHQRGVAVKDLVREHDRPASSLYTILKQKDQLIAAFEASSSNLERQRLRESRWPRLDEALLKWFKDARTIRPPDTQNIVRGSVFMFIFHCQVCSTMRFDSKVNVGFENIKRAWNDNATLSFSYLILWKCTHV